MQGVIGRTNPHTLGKEVAGYYAVKLNYRALSRPTRSYLVLNLLSVTIPMLLKLISSDNITIVALLPHVHSTQVQIL